MIIAVGITLVILAALFYGYYYVLARNPVPSVPVPGLADDVDKRIVEQALFAARDALMRTKDVLKRTTDDPIVSRHALTSAQRNVAILSAMSAGYHAWTQNKDALAKSRFVQVATYYKFRAYLDYALANYRPEFLELYEAVQKDMLVLARALFVERTESSDADMINRLDANTLELYQQSISNPSSI